MEVTTSIPVIFNLRCPSDALEAMCDGLEAADKRADFRVNMDVFGVSHGVHSAGCAAICGVMHASGHQFDPTDINSRDSRWIAVCKHVGTDIEFLLYKGFEYALNDVRAGCMASLFRFFELPTRAGEAYARRWWMGEVDGDWRLQIPIVRRTIAEMREAGY